MPVNSFDQYPLTWKPDKAALKRPYYRSLAADLEDKIRRGVLQAGTKLPPQREIADFLDFNYTTITRVYEACRKKGLIYGITGRGTFVSPHAEEDTTLVSETLRDDVIDLGAVNGYSEHSLLVERATEAVVRKGYLRHLYEYDCPAGYPHQLAAGVRWLEQVGVHTAAERTAVFSGAQNALTVALLSLFDPGDRIAVDPYTYSNFIELAKLMHLVLVPVKGDGAGMLPEELERQCRLNRVKGIYLMPAFANPTTVSIPLARRRELAAVIRDCGLILLEDDIGAWMAAAGGVTVPSLFDLLHGESLYICGMTKSLCPGLRIAFMTYGGRFRKQILHGLSNINIKTSSLDAEIITELILNGDAYRIAKEKRALAEKAGQLFAALFAGRCPRAAEPGYFRWLPLGTKKDPARVEGDLLRRGVRVYHSGRFAVQAGAAQDYLRVSLSSAGDFRHLQKGLERLRDYLEEI